MTIVISFPIIYTCADPVWVSNKPSRLSEDMRISQYDHASEDLYGTEEFASGIIRLLFLDVFFLLLVNGSNDGGKKDAEEGEEGDDDAVEEEFA